MEQFIKDTVQKVNSIITPAKGATEHWGIYYILMVFLAGFGIAQYRVGKTYVAIAQAATAMLFFTVGEWFVSADPYGRNEVLNSILGLVALPFLVVFFYSLFKGVAWVKEYNAKVLEQKFDDAASDAGQG